MQLSVYVVNVDDIRGRLIVTNQSANRGYERQSGVQTTFVLSMAHPLE